ncbi:MAG: putative glycoside hydrolase [Terriglobia bacterium]|jgi:hypothetical protein
MLDHTRIRVFLALLMLAACSAGVMTFLPDASSFVSKPSLIAKLPPWRREPIPLLTSPTPERLYELRLRARTFPELAPVIVDVSGQPTIVHTVKAGDNLGGLANRYLPQTVFMTTGELESAIRQANPSWTEGHLQPGQQLVIPGIETAPNADLRPAPRPKNAEIRAIYLTGWTAGSAHGIELIRRWKGLGGNAVVFDLKDFDGLVTVAFSHPLAPEKQRPPIRSLSKLVRFLRRLGLQSIGRIALFRDEQIATHHPELAVQSRRAKGPWRENGKQVWTDPSRREVQDYNIALAVYAARRGVDEIQFDYVRFPAEGDQADARFAIETEQPAWTRSQVITDFLRRAYDELHSLGVLVSLDVFGVMAWARPVDLAHTGQKIEDMARQCDVLSPMIYPSHFFGMDGYDKPGDAPEHFIGESMDRFRKVTAGTDVVLRPWLQAFAWRTKTYSPDYVHIQLRVAREKGGIGFLFWNARNDYSVPFRAISEKSIVASRALREEKLKPVGDESVPPPAHANPPSSPHNEETLTQQLPTPAAKSPAPQEAGLQYAR